MREDKPMIEKREGPERESRGISTHKVSTLMKGSGMAVGEDDCPGSVSSGTDKVGNTITRCSNCDLGK